MVPPSRVVGDPNQAGGLRKGQFGRSGQRLWQAWAVRAAGGRRLGYSGTMFVIAHAGHWISSLLILLPTVAFIVWLVLITVRDRRRERERSDV
jgi:hypothetical protein